MVVGKGVERVMRGECSLPHLLIIPSHDTAFADIRISHDTTLADTDTRNLHCTIPHLYTCLHSLVGGWQKGDEGWRHMPAHAKA